MPRIIRKPKVITKPIIPWQGGKRRLAKHIIPLIPTHTTYIEPFCGGAAIFFLKPPSKVEVINDINGELINLYRVVKNHLPEFLRLFEGTLISREEFLRHQRTDPSTLSEIQRALRFYYLQRTAFGGKLVSQTFGISTTHKPSLNLLRVAKELKVAHKRLARTYIEKLSWYDCIIKYDRPQSFFYLDPPYWDTVGYGQDFDISQYEKINELARTIKGKMLISINSHDDIRKIFKGLDTTQIDIKHCVTFVTDTQRKVVSELLIKNY